MGGGTSDTAPARTVPADHPGINELFSLLAYGEVAAFYRLTDEARMAPDLRGRINMALMAAAQMEHYELLRSTLESRGVDVLTAMGRYASALENYHRLTMPSTWLEALVKTYVGDAMAADLYLAIATSLPDEIADVVRAVFGETVHSQFVVAEVRSAVNSSGRQRSRLALWSRILPITLAAAGLVALVGGAALGLVSTRAESALAGPGEGDSDLDLGLFGRDETGPMPAAQAVTEKIPTRRPESPPPAR